MVNSGILCHDDTWMNPSFPIYVVSKGRWNSRLTIKALERMRVPYRVVVEEQEYAQYAWEISPDNILILPIRYKDDYDTFWPRGEDNKTGSGAARNFCWDHSIESGANWHWVIDDNIDGFFRLNRNTKLIVDTGAIFAAAEDFVTRYENVPLAGFNYCKFCKSEDAAPPFIRNTRVYSCLLIRNDLPLRWRGLYNEDVDLSLRVLKSGYCTIQFNAFLCEKLTTQKMSGGNTDELYTEGTLKKSQMLAEMHPDVARVVWKFDRWHHQVDYGQFKRNQLRFRPGVVIKEGIDNYGMVLKELASKPA
jgi:hypothetical protein